MCPSYVQLRLGRLHAWEDATVPHTEQGRDADAHAGSQQQLPTEQQQLPEAHRPSMQTGMIPIADISYTWRQRARSSFGFCYPKAERTTESQNSVKGSSGLKKMSSKPLGGTQHEQAAMAQGSLAGGPDTRQLPAAAADLGPQSRSAAGVPVHEKCMRQQPDQADPSSQLSATEINFIAETTRAAELISRVKNYQQKSPLKLGQEDLATIHELNALADPQAAFQSLAGRVQSQADKLVKSGRIKGTPPGVLCCCMDAMTSTEGLCAVSMPCKPLSSCAAGLPNNT